MNICVFFPLIKFMSFCLIMSSIQWIIIMIYNHYCLDSSIYGIVTNIFTLGSPICSSLNKIQTFISDSYITFFGGGILLFTGWVNNLLILNNN